MIVTVGSADKAEACRGLGADHAIDYKTQDFVADVQRLTDGTGANVVLDMVAGDYIARDIQCLAEDGRIVIIAVQGGTGATVDAGLAIGARICALVAGGGYAELCVAPVAQCLPSPANLSDVEAASLPETFFTVWSNVFDRARLQRGETLLVHGG